MLPLNQAFGELKISLYDANDKPSSLALKIDELIQKEKEWCRARGKKFDYVSYSKEVRNGVEGKDEARSVKSMAVSNSLMNN
jgi:hypothetical protein